MEKTVNERVKELRNSLNLSQLEFASAVNSTITSISRMENGSSQPRKSTLKHICSVFAVPEEWLINGKGEMSFEAKELPAKEINPWKDALVQQLQEEVSFLRSIVSNMSQNKSGSFLNGIAPAGFFDYKKLGNTVRV